MTAVPMLIGRWMAMPWWSTSQGALPSVARTIIASVTPYSTRPTASWVRRRGSRPARSWATGPEAGELAHAAARASCVVSRPTSLVMRPVHHEVVWS